MKKPALLFLFFLLSCLHLTAQTDIQRLWKVVHDKKQADTLRLEALRRICMEGYLYRRPDSAAFYADRLYRMASQLHSTKYQALALNVHGASSSLRGDNKRAIAYFTKSLKIMEKLEDQKGIASCLNNIGVIYDEMGQTKKAEGYYQRALTINKLRKDSSSIALSYSNLGNIYRYQQDYEKSIRYHQKAIKIYETLHDDFSLGMSLHFIGVTYFDMGDYKQALSYNERSIPYYEKSDNLPGLPEVLTIHGKIYAKLGDTQKAIDFNKRALALAQEVGVASGTREASLFLYKQYKKTGNLKEALAMHELYILMRDSIINEESQQELITQELSHQFEKERALDQKEHEKRLAVQKAIIVSTGIGSLFVLILAIVVINRLQITRKQKKIIEGQKNLVEEKQKEILDSITYAKRLQDAILPPLTLFREHFPESFILYKPKDIVAGDFYWMEKLENSVLIAVADCTGHGVPGAMVSVVCSTALNRAVLEFGITDPGEILDKTRELVLETFAKSSQGVKDGMDISLASINMLTGEIRWAGANNALWYVSVNELHQIAPDKQPIGSSFDPRPFTTHRLQLQKGDLLFLFTDGYADQFGGEKGKKFKYKPLKDLLFRNAQLSLSEQEKQLDLTFENWKNGLEQVDDVCVLGVRI